MAPSNIQHRRTHNLLLISKLLNQRDTVSPLTLILDSLEQSSKPLVAEFIARANVARVDVIFVSFETLRKPKDASAVVQAWGKQPAMWQEEVMSHLRRDPAQRKLLVFDSLSSLATSDPAGLPGLLSTFIGPTISILAVYHTDVPVSTNPADFYTPPPLVLLKYIATTIFTTHNHNHVLARKAARDRSHVEPCFGLEEGLEGVVGGIGANGAEGVVLEMEHRRKSGRGVREWYYLSTDSTNMKQGLSKRSRETVILLEDHPAYQTKEEKVDAEEATADSTFELGLTAKQRQDREGVVLPYFDAQQGGGEGGRILYDMGSEDDFDEEEDEI